MGKSRGGKSKPYKGNRGKKDPGEEDDESSGEEFVAKPRGLGGQPSTVGMLPPSDSEEDEEKAAKKAAKAAGPSKAAASATESKQPVAQNKQASKKPADDSDSSSEEDSSSEDEKVQMHEYLTAPKKKAVAAERDPEEIRLEIERLELTRKKREQDRLKRIKDEGWDRFAPMTEANKPPGHGPVTAAPS